MYRWFQGIYLSYVAAQAQAAVNEYLKWSGLTMSTIGNDPDPAGYCNYLPPGVSFVPRSFWKGYGPAPFVTSYTDRNNRIPACFSPPSLACVIGADCEPIYPSPTDFQAWGAYDVANQDGGFNSPDLAERIIYAGAQIGFATTLAQAPAGTCPSSCSLLGSGGQLNKTGTLLKNDVLSGVVNIRQSILQGFAAGVREVPRSVQILAWAVNKSTTSILEGIRKGAAASSFFKGESFTKGVANYYRLLARADSGAPDIGETRCGQHRFCRDRRDPHGGARSHSPGSQRGCA